MPGLRIALLCVCGHESAPGLATICDECGGAVCLACRATHPHPLPARPEYPAGDRCARCGEASDALAGCLWCEGWYCPGCRVELGEHIRPACADCLAEARVDWAGDPRPVADVLAAMVAAGEVKAVAA
jgi:hypothetical protein